MAQVISYSPEGRAVDHSSNIHDAAFLGVALLSLFRRGRGRRHDLDISTRVCSQDDVQNGTVGEEDEEKGEQVKKDIKLDTAFGMHP